MGVGARGCRTWRARSRAGIALLALTSWFGALLAISRVVSASTAVTTTSPGAVDPVHGLPAIPGAVPGTDVPRAIKNVLGQTITKPQLPLALFVIVLLFLLVQNQIDRRDPKLAAAPVTAEPELTFGPTLRPGGATA
jgi:hypothetical protein